MLALVHVHMNIICCSIWRSIFEEFSCYELMFKQSKVNLFNLTPV